MESRRVSRILRQHVEADRLLGVPWVPVGATVLVGSLEEIPAPPSPAPPVRSDPPTTAMGISTNLFATAASSNPGSGDSASKLKILQALEESEVRNCTLCPLCQSRTHTVFGEGDPDAKLMFVGEGPGESEDLQGRPFVGRAGQMLDKQIEAMGLKREQVYIANVVKCRPPQNRAPTPIEAQTCWSYLRRQILTIQPRVIVALGGPAAKQLLNTPKGITSIRGVWHWFEGLVPDGPVIPVMPTFHPAYLLRAYTPENRKKVWSDLQEVMRYLAGGGDLRGGE